MRAAQDSLEADPDNPKTNFLVGRWLLLQKGDAKQGLAHLAKGSDSTFRQLARQELAAEPTEIESLAKLADAWWDLAQLQTDEGKEQLARHAGQLYKIALPKLSGGLRKALVERRLEELASPKRVIAETVSQKSEKAAGEALKPGEVLPLGRLVDLLPLVDLKRDSTGGFWERNGDVLLTTQPKKNATVLLPVTAEGDYRLETHFTRTAGQDAVAMIVPVGGNPCLMTFSESSGKTSRLGIGGKLGRPERENKIRVDAGHPYQQPEARGVDLGPATRQRGFHPGVLGRRTLLQLVWRSEGGFRRGLAHAVHQAIRPRDQRVSDVSQRPPAADLR